MRIRAATATAYGLLIFLSSGWVGGAPPPVEPGADEAAPTCERLVEFRDGSILRVQLPAAHEFEFHKTGNDPGGGLERSSFRLDDSKVIRFSKLPALKQLRTIQAAVNGLRADSFKLREQALRTLVVGGKGFRPFLEELLNGVSDPEARWRLAVALELLPPYDGLHDHAYDEITTDAGTSKGDVDDWSVSATYGGIPLRLDRASVRTIRSVPPAGKHSGSPVIATTEEIRKDLDVLFPEDCVRIDFEEDSQGVPLRPGQDISRRFIFDGLILETSITDSFVSVNDHVVSGRSGGQSAATHEPLYQGTITLTFCVPGNENEPGGVTHVGLSAAIVQEGGTTLAAFDASGHRIASVLTVAGPHQFFGLRSDVPIHQVKIIPGSDPDYTFDDLVFDVPEAIDAGGAAQHHSLDFSSGERLICGDFRMEGGSLIARPAGEFADELSFPAADLIQLRTPTEGQGNLPPDDGERFWVMLADGSTLLAIDRGDGKMPTTLLDRLPLDSLPVSALWSEADELVNLPDDTVLEPGQVATIVTTVPTLLTKPVLTPSKFTATDGDATVEYSYNRLPTVWLQNFDRQARQKASGFVRLNTGERLVLGESSTFQLGSFDQQAATLTLGTGVVKIPLATLSTLRLPK